jgi:beta-galactosidase
MKTLSYCCLFLSLVLPFSAFPQRINQTINSNWLFQKGEVDAVGAVENPDEWTRVNLPHTWNIDDVSDEAKGYYRGPGWYAKVLRIPAEWEDKQVFIHFEGANQEATVFLNGRQLGHHIGGYTAFRFNLSSYLNFGDDNLLTVRVTNELKESIPPLSGDFTIYGGIYRDVRLIVTDPVHFDMDNDASDGVFTVVKEVSKEKAAVALEGALVNRRERDRAVRVETQIVDRDRNIVASDVTEITLGAAGRVDFQTSEMKLQNPNLWSPDSPYLYAVNVRMVGAKDGGVLDEITLPLGLRWFEFDEQNRFVLNGEPIKLVGANRHQDLPGKGSALSDEDHRKDYTMAREMGLNFVRLAHYPQDQEVYRTCDEVGLLVWSENQIVNQISPTATVESSEEFTSNCLKMQREHIRQTRNHPSMVFYGYMNEILLRPLKWDISQEELDQVGKNTLELTKKLEVLTKQEAPDCKTVMAVHYDEAYNKYGLADVVDVIGWNLYFGWYYDTKEDFGLFLDDQHARYPNRPLIVSEYGPGADIRCRTESPVLYDFTEDYQLVMHESYLKQMMDRPFVTGFAAWNFADFGSEGRQDTIRAVNQKGLHTFDRQEKNVCGLYRARFSGEPVVYIALRHYLKQGGIEDAAGKGASTHPVKIYSNGGDVELFLNGVSLGKQPADTYAVVFDVPFRDGVNVLKAVDGSGAEDELEVDFELYTDPLTADGERDEIAVNVGAHYSFYDPESEILWMADREYTPGLWGTIGGAPFKKDDGRKILPKLSDNILGSTNDALFQSFNRGLEGYRFDVGDGLYEVTLCFAEPDTDTPEEALIYTFSEPEKNKEKAGARVFDVEINGTRVLDDLNLAREFGPLQAVTTRFRVHAKDSKGIELKFLPVQGEPVLSGIRIRPM